MNCRAATAFLPKFVGFPSLRGLHSSTVQLRRAPVPGRRAPVRRDSRLEPERTGARATDGPLKCPLDARSCRSHASTRRSVATVVLQACEVAGTHSESPDRGSTHPPDGNLGLNPCSHRAPGPPTRHRTQRGARPRCGPRVRWCGFPVGSAADVCQLPPPPQPPPPPPPPQDDPPPQDEPPPQEWPPWCPPDEPESPPPAHQLPPLSWRADPVDAHPPRRAVRPDPPLRALDTSAPTSRTPITARMMPTTMASPSFRFPRSGPPRAPRSCVNRGCPPPHAPKQS